MRHREYNRLRRLTEEGVAAVDHGALTGLGDDDHPHYLNELRGDTRYYTQAQVDALIAASTASVGSNPDGGSSSSACETYIDGGTSASACTDYPFSHKLDGGASA